MERDDFTPLRPFGPPRTPQYRDEQRLLRRSPNLPHLISPTPHHPLPRTSLTILTPTFSINPYYLSLLGRLRPNTPLPVPIAATPLALEDTARVEPIEEGEGDATQASQVAVPTYPPGGEEGAVHPAEDGLQVTNQRLSPCTAPSSPQLHTPPEEGREPPTFTQTHAFIDPGRSDMTSATTMDVDPAVQALIGMPTDKGNLRTHDLVPEIPVATFPARPADDIPVFELPPVSPEPVPAPTPLNEPAPSKRQAMRGTFRPPRQKSPDAAQWRTGKAPGYQGLTQKRRCDAVSDHEDEPHDIARSAERVLKRPFRPPTIISAPKVKLSPIQVDHGGSSTNSRPRAAPARRLGSRLRAKPFIPPSKASESVSLARSNSSSKPVNKAMDLNLSLIASLEARLRTLRQAIKYDDPEEDARLVGLVHTWRDAGREITDRLFALLPTPTEEDGDLPPGSRSGWSSGGWNDWGFSSDRSESKLTKDQHDALRAAPVDKDGEMLDEWGNRIFEDDGDGDGDLGSLIDQAMGSYSYVDPTPSYPVNEEPTPPKDTVWDQGAMLLRFGVDPDLLGWDRETEEWVEVPDF